jgi:preprotein translocase subunit SecF
MSKRRERRLKGKQKQPTEVGEQTEQVKVQARTSPKRMMDWHGRHYKKLLIIPFLLLILALCQLGWQFASTGDFVSKGVTLKGGITITVTAVPDMTAQEIEATLAAQFPEHELAVRDLNEQGARTGILVESDIDNVEQSDALNEAVRGLYETELASLQISVESTGSSLGEDFFRQTSMALLVAFIFMGIVVFVLFRTVVPSLAVILAAFSDIIITIAIFNIFGFKLSTAGVAAFLMLVGYSVDTDILLSNRVLKRKGGNVTEKILSAAKTGFLMTLTTIAAVTVALIITDSQVIAQIMTILLIGLIVDLIMTWLQNAGLLRWYVERRGEH